MALININCLLSVCCRWKDQAALQAAEAEAHNRVAQLSLQQQQQQEQQGQQQPLPKQQQQVQLLADALTWPSRAYMMDSRAAAPLWLALR